MKREITLEDKIYLLGANDIEVFSTAINSLSIENSMIKVKTKVGYEPIFDIRDGLKTCYEYYDKDLRIYFTTNHKKALEESNGKANRKKGELMQEVHKLTKIIQSNDEKINNL